MTDYIALADEVRKFRNAADITNSQMVLFTEVATALREAHAEIERLRENDRRAADAVGDWRDFHQKWQVDFLRAQAAEKKLEHVREWCGRRLDEAEYLLAHKAKYHIDDVVEAYKTEVRNERILDILNQQEDTR